MDGRNSVPVTLFDEFGLTLDKALPENGDEDVILIICCAKINRYEGNAQLSNYPATRIYINRDHYSVENIQNRENEISDFSSFEEEEVERLTLNQITTLTEEHIKKEVCCEVLVNKVHADRQWYITNCPKCANALNFENEKFKCPNCNRIVPHPRRRFQVHTLCSDNTASVTILFPDSVVSKILQKNVEDLYSPEKEELGEQGFPPDLYILRKPQIQYHHSAE